MARALTKLCGRVGHYEVWYNKDEDRYEVRLNGKIVLRDAATDTEAMQWARHQNELNECENLDESFAHMNERWVTMNHTHVEVTKRGRVIKGPERLRKSTENKKYPRYGKARKKSNQD